MCREVHDRRSKVSDEQLNSAQVALADGIAERVVSAIRRDQDRTPERILQQEMARQMVAALHKDGTLKPLTKFGAGRNRGPPLDEDQPAAMTIPEFCAWAKISRSTLYAMWSDGVGPKFFKAGTTTRSPAWRPPSGLSIVKPRRRPKPLLPKPPREGWRHQGARGPGLNFEPTSPWLIRLAA